MLSLRRWEKRTKPWWSINHTWAGWARRWWNTAQGRPQTWPSSSSTWSTAARGFARPWRLSSMPMLASIPATKSVTEVQAPTSCRTLGLWQTPWREAGGKPWNQCGATWTEGEWQRSSRPWQTDSNKRPSRQKNGSPRCCLVLQGQPWQSVRVRDLFRVWPFLQSSPEATAPEDWGGWDRFDPRPPIWFDQTKFPAFCSGPDKKGQGAHGLDWHSPLKLVSSKTRRWLRATSSSWQHFYLGITWSQRVWCTQSSCWKCVTEVFCCCFPSLHPTADSCGFGESFNFHVVGLSSDSPSSPTSTCDAWIYWFLSRRLSI